MLLHSLAGNIYKELFDSKKGLRQKHSVMTFQVKLFLPLLTDVTIGLITFEYKNWLQ